MQGLIARVSAMGQKLTYGDVSQTSAWCQRLFEWRAITGTRAKQPYAIAMKDGSPFGLAGIWERWRNPNTGE